MPREKLEKRARRLCRLVEHVLITDGSLRPAAVVSGPKAQFVINADSAFADDASKDAFATMLRRYAAEGATEIVLVSEALMMAAPMADIQKVLDMSVADSPQRIECIVISLSNPSSQVLLLKPYGRDSTGWPILLKTPPTVWLVKKGSFGSYLVGRFCDFWQSTTRR